MYCYVRRIRGISICIIKSQRRLCANERDYLCVGLCVLCRTVRSTSLYASCHYGHFLFVSCGCRPRVLRERPRNVFHRRTFFFSTLDSLVFAAAMPVLFCCLLKIYSDLTSTFGFILNALSVVCCCYCYRHTHRRRRLSFARCLCAYLGAC